MTEDGNAEKQVEINFTIFDGKVYIVRITTANFGQPVKKEITNRILDSFTFTATHYNQRNAHYDLEEYQLAIDDYDKAIALNSDYTDAYNNRGLSYYNLKEDQSAIDNYDKAIALNPDYTDAYNNEKIGNFLIKCDC